MSCGHPESEITLVKDRAKKRRSCRACHREWQREYDQRKREKRLHQADAPTIWPELKAWPVVRW